MTYSNAADLARLSLHNPDDLTVQHAQTLHRLALIQHFQIVPGSKVLELGCGQGDCTTVLADAVGEAGSVVAVDPAPLTYGTSTTFPSMVGCKMRRDHEVYSRSRRSIVCQGTFR
jgi:predicted methyltransferase